MDEAERELILALRHAVSGEIRFGIKEAARPELEQRWSEALAKLKRWLTLP